MNHETTLLNPVEFATELPIEKLDVALDEELETTGDVHRLAAHHFAAAAKFHLMAADAADEGDQQANSHHAYLAYGHQLNAVQYAEVAVMENDNLEEEELEEEDAEVTHG